MQQIADWLNTLGLGQYAQRFAENYIDACVLPDLTDQDLEKIGIPLGHRKKLLRAIRELADVSPAARPPATASKPAPHDTAERRQLTVMFCDLVGSAALSGKLDPEDLRGVIAIYHRCCTQMVERNGGFVAKYIGDGVLAYFGYPQAHEHDAERAVRAGLALVEAVPKLTTAAGVPLQARVGIATGLVVVGDLIGAGAAQEQAVVGETPNLAARLQGLAEPNAVVIASSTRGLTGGLFEYRDLRTVSVKGFGPVQVWQVTGASAVESRFEALRTAMTPLVGREEEIELLLRRWGQAKCGDGQVVLISGEPGIGKSRIAQTIVERISGEPHTRLRYFCSPHHQDGALYPSIAQLERAAGLHRDDTPRQRLAKLEAVLAQGTNDLGEAVPLLADLLSIPAGEHYQPLNLTPQKRKEKTLHAQLAQVEGLAARQPVLMVWEDVHWSDPSTRESLDLLVDRVPTLRVLMILTFRQEFTPPWIGRPHVMLLTLNRLPTRQRAEMIVQVTGGKVLPKEIEQQIVDRTDGIPLFIEELTKSVIETGIVTEAGNHYAVAGPVVPLAIPTSLHASLLARLDRLAPTREVAQIGAALGRSFSHELISAVAQMPQPQIDDALKQLASAELIFCRGTPPDAEYTFKHALVQDAAYGTLLRARRRALHRRIAEALEAHFPDTAETQPELQAHHLAEAGLTERAVDCCLRAGRRAMARSAMAEAVSQLRRGLQLIPALPDAKSTQERELDLRIALGHALTARYNHAVSEVGETFARARQLCERLGEKDKLVLVMFGEYCYQVLRAGRSALPPEVASAILDLGEAWNDSRTRYLGYRCLAVYRFYEGEFAAARSHFERALALYDPAHRAYLTELTAEDPHCSTLMHFSWALACLGYLDQARARRDEGLAEARRSGKVDVLAFAIQMSLVGDQILRSLQFRLERADELIALSAKHGFLHSETAGKANRAWCLALSANAEQAIAPLQEHLAAHRATGQELWVPYNLIRLAVAYGLAGLPQEGLKVLAEADEYILPSQGRWWVAELHRLRGDLLRSTGDDTAAEDSFRRGLAVARRQEAKLIELRAATGLARVWRDHGRAREASELLGPLFAWFTEGLDAPDLQDAKALLDQLG
jgi:class 3 adenylate cyclase/predicted ATPase